jgi:hypothetical protein
MVSPGELESTRLYQSDELVSKEFDKTKWKSVVGDVDFIEDPEEKAKQKPVAMPSAPWAGPLLQVFSYAAVVALVVFILYYILKNTRLDAKLKTTTIQVADMVKQVEDIAEIDIDGLLAKARAEGNFKLAVRLYYLSLLKKLNTLEIIAWKKDKTNHDYLSELFSRDYHFDEMKRLTRTYEEVWYGEHVLTPESFQQISARFETLDQKLHTSQTP